MGVDAVAVSSVAETTQASWSCPPSSPTIVGRAVATIVFDNPNVEMLTRYVSEQLLGWTAEPPSSQTAPVSSDDAPEDLDEALAETLEALERLVDRSAKR